MTDPYREREREKAIQLISFKPLPEGLEMTLLTSVKILTPLSAMALHDGRGFADLPEKLKALRIFS